MLQTFFCELSQTLRFYVAICLFLIIDETNCNYVAQRAVKCAAVKGLMSIP